MFSLSLNSPLHNIFFTKKDSFLREFILMLMGICLISCSAQISIPLNPVPLTFQTTAIILVSLIYGTELATKTVIMYLLAGISGLPVFANFTGGLPIILGPNGGYLIAFVPAASLCGYLSQHGWGQHFISSFLAAILGTLIIFAGGALWLTLLFGYQKAFEVGVLPFVMTEPAKLFFVALLAPKCWERCKLN